MVYLISPCSDDYTQSEYWWWGLCLWLPVTFHSQLPEWGKMGTPPPLILSKKGEPLFKKSTENGLLASEDQLTPFNLGS